MSFTVVNFFATYCQLTNRPFPRYELLQERGKNKLMCTLHCLDQKSIGWGETKRVAKLNAASALLLALPCRYVELFEGFDEIMTYYEKSKLRIVGKDESAFKVNHQKLLVTLAKYFQNDMLNVKRRRTKPLNSIAVMCCDKATQFPPREPEEIAQTAENKNDDECSAEMPSEGSIPSGRAKDGDANAK